MPELHRGSLRYELRLSGTQVAGIVVGALVTVGAAFALGVGFGSRLAANPPTPKAPDKVEIKSDVIDAGIDFTYQRELTKVDPAPKPAPVPPPPPKAAPIVAVAPPLPLDAGVAADAGAIAAIIAAADEPPPQLPPDQPKPDPRSAETSSDVRFAVQFGAPANRGDADKLAAKLSTMGYGAYVVPAEIPLHGTVYRVRVGRFANKEAADALRQDAQSHHQLSGIVMPVK